MMNVNVEKNVYQTDERNHEIIRTAYAINKKIKRVG